MTVRPSASESGIHRPLTGLPRRFYRRDPHLVAPDLLNKLLVAGDRSGRIVEVEAYGGADDPASHAYRGSTPRNATMFGPPGRLYVYLSYGIHWCANAVCGEEGEAGAVLVRALAPVDGLEEMRAARPAARRDRDLCSGPGKLCAALGLSRQHDGADLVSGEGGVVITDVGADPPAEAARGVRVGVGAGAEALWRWWVPDDPNVSRPGRVRVNGWAGRRDSPRS
ncbi:MAG: DNA-3-methyladenine glycosylase [Acidimicrobiales bacterium]